MALRVKRGWFVTDKNGVEHRITCKEDLQKILDEMTPEEKQTWQDNYRFCPVTNLTGNKDYTGTARDLG